MGISRQATRKCHGGKVNNVFKYHATCQGKLSIKIHHEMSKAVAKDTAESASVAVAVVVGKGVVVGAVGGQ